MPTRHPANVPHPPKLGGKWAVILFVITLFAFVAESQLTQYVQTTLQYRQPFFIFYIVHSSFAIIFPMHLLYLMATSKYSASALINGLSVAVSDHLSPPETGIETLGGTSSSLQRFPTYRFMRLVFALTVGITCPSLLWFAAISLASISDVTALWNTSPFFVYIITVKMFHLKWEPRRMMAVSLAILGTIGVLYGGSTSSSSSGSGDIDIAANTQIEIEARTTKMAKPTAPLVGDILIVIASVGYAFYQVLYKKYAALPSDPEVASEGLYESIPASSDGLYNANETASIIITDSEMDAMPITPPPPFGFHPNMLTSSIGLCTFIILWIPIPILHYFDLEPFRFPANSLTVIAIAGIAFTGVIFNAGFMILLGAWGPIITSVGNLLTIVLVFFSDVLFGAGIEAVNVWGLVGSAVIVAAFAVLAYDMFRGR